MIEKKIAEMKDNEGSYGLFVIISDSTTEDNGPYRQSGCTIPLMLTNINAQPFNQEPIYNTGRTEIFILNGSSWMISRGVLEKMYSERRHAGLDAHTARATLVAVNDIMVILDHFGFDADYRTPFLRLVRKNEELIRTSTFRIKGSRRNKRCKFNGKEYKLEEFVKLFDQFLDNNSHRV